MSSWLKQPPNENHSKIKILRLIHMESLQDFSLLQLNKFKSSLWTTSQMERESLQNPSPHIQQECKSTLHVHSPSRSPTRWQLEHLWTCPPRDPNHTLHQWRALHPLRSEPIFETHQCHHPWLFELQILGRHSCCAIPSHAELRQTIERLLFCQCQDCPGSNSSWSHFNPNWNATKQKTWQSFPDLKMVLDKCQCHGVCLSCLWAHFLKLQSWLVKRYCCCLPIHMHNISQAKEIPHWCTMKSVIPYTFA